MTIKARRPVYSADRELSDSVLARVRSLTSMLTADMEQVPYFVYSYASPILFGLTVEDEYKQVAVQDFEAQIKTWVKKNEQLRDMFEPEESLVITGGKTPDPGPVYKAVNYAMQRSLTPILTSYAAGMTEMFPKLKHESLQIPTDLSIFVSLIQSIFVNLATSKSAESSLLHLTSEIQNNSVFSVANNVFGLISLESNGFVPVRRGHALMLSAALLKRSDVIKDAGISIEATATGYKIVYDNVLKHPNPADFLGSAIRIMLSSDISHQTAAHKLADNDFLGLIQQWRGSYGLDPNVTFSDMPHSEDFLNVYNLLVVDIFMKKVYRREGHAIVSDLVQELKALSPSTNILNETDLTLTFSGMFLLYDSCIQAAKEMAQIALEMLNPYGVAESLSIPSLNILANPGLTSNSKPLAPGSSIIRTLVKFERAFSNRIDNIVLENTLLQYAKFTSLSYVASLPSSLPIVETEIDFMYTNGSIDVDLKKDKIMVLSSDMKTLSTFNLYADSKFPITEYLKDLRTVEHMENRMGVVPQKAITVCPPYSVSVDTDPPMMLDQNLVRLMYMYPASQATAKGYDFHLSEKGALEVVAIQSAAHLLSFLGLSLFGDSKLVENIISLRKFTFPNVYYCYKPGAVIITEYKTAVKYRVLTLSSELMVGKRLMPTNVIEMLDIAFI